MKYFTKLPLIFDEEKLVESLEQVLEIAPWPDEVLNADKKYLTEGGVFTDDFINN